jgi:hypothetical protein
MPAIILRKTWFLIPPLISAQLPNMEWINRESVFIVG